MTLSFKNVGAMIRLLFYRFVPPSNTIMPIRRFALALVIVSLAACDKAPLPADYVGEWRSIRAPNIETIVQLNPDGSYVAVPVNGQANVAMSGKWWLEGRGDTKKMAWRHSKPMPASEANLITHEKRADGGKTGPLAEFSLFEEDGRVSVLTRVK